MNKISVKVCAPASCGEIIQGVFFGQVFASSYAIDLYSQVIVSSDEGEHYTRLPLKSRRTVENFINHFNISKKYLKEIKFKHFNPIPLEKGMGSSTADLYAIVVALSCVFEKKIDNESIAFLTSLVDPSDSILYSDICLINTETGKLIKNSDIELRYSVLILQLEKKVNTLKFRQKLSVVKQRDYNYLYFNALKAFEDNDLEKLMYLSQFSAFINQKINPKPYLDKILRLSHLNGVIGINIGHSGSVIGIIYDERSILQEKLENEVKRIDSKNFYLLSNHKIVSAKPIISIF